MISKIKILSLEKSYYKIQAANKKLKDLFHKRKNSNNP